MSEIRRELAAGKELKSSKAKTKLPDELLAGIQGAGWETAKSLDSSDDNINALFDVWVVWRAPGTPDKWCTVESVTKTNEVITSLDLYCPADGYIYYDIPATQVLVDCID